LSRKSSFVKVHPRWRIKRCINLTTSYSRPHLAILPTRLHFFVGRFQRGFLRRSPISAKYKKITNGEMETVAF